MKIPLFDAHCDTISQIFVKSQSLIENTCHIDFSKASVLEPYVQIFALYSDIKKTLDTTPFNQFFQLYRKFIAETEQRNPDKIVLCRNTSDIAEAARGNKIAAMLSVEGAELLDCSLEKLQVAYDLGVRAINVVWNNRNALSGSCAEAPEEGLTDKGKEFVERMFDLGIMVDVSHISEPGFWDVAEIAQRRGRPFIASHSNSKKICGHRRNLTDDQFLAIKSLNGFVGINLYRDLVNTGHATLDHVIGHIEHFLSLGGAGIIGIGADFDGCEDLPLEIGNISDMWKLYDGLLKKNYSEQLVRDIFYFNLLRMVKDICDT